MLFRTHLESILEAVTDRCNESLASWVRFAEAPGSALEAARTAEAPAAVEAADPASPPRRSFAAELLDVVHGRAEMSFVYAEFVRVLLRNPATGVHKGVVSVRNGVLEGVFSGRAVSAWISSVLPPRSAGSHALASAASGSVMGSATAAAQLLMHAGVFFSALGESETFDADQQALYCFMPSPLIRPGSVLEYFDREVAATVRDMRDPTNGLRIEDRRSLTRNLRKCFAGQEAVDWFVRRYTLRSRAEGVLLGQTLVNRGVLVNAGGARHPFKDSSALYEFGDLPAHNSLLLFREHRGGLGPNNGGGELASSAAPGLSSFEAVHMRWFCLRDRVLTWFRTPFSTAPLGSANLSDCALALLRPRPAEVLRLALAVRCADGRVLELQTRSVADLKEWVEAVYPISVHYDNDYLARAEQRIAIHCYERQLGEEVQLAARHKRQREEHELRERRVYFESGALSRTSDGSPASDTYVVVDFSVDHQLTMSRELEARRAMASLMEQILQQQKLQHFYESQYLEEFVGCRKMLLTRGVHLPWELNRGEVERRMADTRVQLYPLPQVALYGVCDPGMKPLIHLVWTELSACETALRDAFDRSVVASIERMHGGVLPAESEMDAEDHIGAVVQSVIARVLVSSAYFPCSLVLAVFVNRRMWVFSHGGAQAMCGFDFWSRGYNLDSASFLRAPDEVSAIAPPPDLPAHSSLSSIHVQNSARVGGGRGGVPAMQAPHSSMSSLPRAQSPMPLPARGAARSAAEDVSEVRSKLSESVMAVPVDAMHVDGGEDWGSGGSVRNYGGARGGGGSGGGGSHVGGSPFSRGVVLSDVDMDSLHKHAGLVEVDAAASSATESGAAERARLEALQASLQRLAFRSVHHAFTPASLPTSLPAIFPAAADAVAPASGGAAEAPVHHAPVNSYDVRVRDRARAVARAGNAAVSAASGPRREIAAALAGHRDRSFVLCEVLLPAPPAYDFVVLANAAFWAVTGRAECAEAVARLRSARRSAFEIAENLLRRHRERSGEVATVVVLFYHMFSS